MEKNRLAIINIFIVILVFSAFSAAKAQDKLQPYLSDLIRGKTQAYSKGLNAYAEGDYAKAYKFLKQEDAKNVPYLEEFLQNALLYQRDNKLIKKVIKENSTKVPETYKFYVKHPQMKLEMNKNSTAVALNKNLFKAILGDGEEIIVMLDTGGSGVGITEELVKKYKMKTDTSISTKGSLPAFNITFFKHPVIIPKITIGGMKLTGIYAEYSVADPESKGKYTGSNFDVIMGLDTFVGYLDEVSFDWENEKLIFKKHSDSGGGKPFLFHSSKPFTSYSLNEKNLTTIIDTGSAVDLLKKDVYLNNYSKKEAKIYGNYSYNQYTVSLKTDSQNDLKLKVADYLDSLNLIIGGENIDLLLGNGHEGAVFNLKNNRFKLR